MNLAPKESMSVSADQMSAFVTELGLAAGLPTCLLYTSDAADDEYNV